MEVIVKKKKNISLILLFALLLNMGSLSYANEELNSTDTLNSTELSVEEEQQNIQQDKVTEPSDKDKNIVDELYGSNLDNSIDENSDLNIFLNSSTNIKRISGSNRVNTSALISNFTNEKAEKVIIADGRNYADALSGSSITFGEYPILLVDGVLNSDTINEIKRLDAKEAIILGGEKSISLAVEVIWQNWIILKK